jgi:exopolyphosphatase/guanosine-5'-triphosphate,3'-diphosphate pyrophosphatase
MHSVRRAVIDVGTNSIKLLVADVHGREVQPVHEESRQTRLGQGFYKTHRLQPETIASTAEAVWDFTKTARDRGAESIRVVATSAARDALNPTDLTQAIEKASGLQTEIISGEAEADYAFQGVTSEPSLADQALLLLDVGGGSTEFILGRAAQKTFARSFPLGTVRLMENFPHSDPPTANEFSACQKWVQDFLRTEVRPQLAPALAAESGKIKLIGTGGTTSILARVFKKLDRFDRDKIDRTILEYDQIVACRKQLWSLPLLKRKEVPGLPKLRADVILMGVLIYELIMAEFGFAQVQVSTRGLRFAVVMH